MTNTQALILSVLLENLKEVPGLVIRHEMQYATLVIHLDLYRSGGKAYREAMWSLRYGKRGGVSYHGTRLGDHHSGVSARGSAANGLVASMIQSLKALKLQKEAL